MQAIRTRYLGPTNARGSRVSARCEAGNLTMEWDDALSPKENHNAARDALLRKLGWDKPPYSYRGMVSGVFAGDWYHVFKD